MIRAEEQDREEKSNEKMNPIYPIVNAQHSIYMTVLHLENQLRVAFFILRLFCQEVEM